MTFLTEETEEKFWKHFYVLFFVKAKLKYFIQTVTIKTTFVKKFRSD
jgi:hypothetical protein